VRSEAGADAPLVLKILPAPGSFSSRAIKPDLCHHSPPVTYILANRLDIAAAMI
jgi:hypothetical protein